MVLPYSPVTLVLQFPGILFVPLVPKARNKMLRNVVWWLRCVFFLSVSVSSSTTFRTLACPDISDYAMYWNLSTYAWPYCISSVCTPATIFVWPVNSLVSPFSILDDFLTRCTSTSVSLTFKPRVVGGIITLSTYTVFCIQLSSNVEVPGFLDMTLNGPTADSNKFVRDRLAMSADSVSCTVGLSTKTCGPGFNYMVHNKVLSNVPVWRIWAVLCLRPFARGGFQLQEKLELNANLLWQLCHISWDVCSRF